MDLPDALSFLASDPGATGIFTDFDGTMSPIVDHPADALPVAGAEETLEELAGRFAVVAVVSGRSLDDLRSRLSPSGVLLAGSYGRERSDQAGRVAPGESMAAGRLYQAALEATVSLDGVRLESKGGGVALHYRGAPEHASEVGRIAATLALDLGLEVRPGRMVFELTPPGPGKGEAIRELIEERRLAHVLVAGDDVADGEAFEVVRTMPVKPVLVAVRSEESPPGLLAGADVVVDGPRALVDLLASLARLLRQ